jgi:hypothetical protein
MAHAPPRFVCGFTGTANTLSTIEVRHGSRSKTRKCELVREWRSVAVSGIDTRRALCLGSAGDVRSGPENAYQRLAVAQLA